MLEPSPVVLMVSPTGARRTKSDHAALPITPEEIARATAASAESGASMVHLHVRDREGAHTLDANAYRETITAIERECGKGRVVIQLTSEQVGKYAPSDQIALIRELRPEAISISVKELIPDAAAERAADALTDWMATEQIAVQWIVYSRDELRRYLELRERDVIAPAANASLMFVLGRYTDGQESDPRSLLDYLEELGADTTPWMVCAFDSRECAVALTAAALGGHARVGFENNLLLADGSVAGSPSALVRQCAQALPLVGHRVATTSEARKLFGVRG